MSSVTPERFAILKAWFAGNAENFTSETALTIAAGQDIPATGSELDLLALWFRELPATIEGQATLDDLEQDLKDDPEEPAAEHDEAGHAAEPDGAGQGGERQAHGSTEQPPKDSEPTAAAPESDDPPAVPSAELAVVELSDEEREFSLDQRRAKAYALSGYWKDAQQLAQALVKIEAGRELGLPAIVAMADIYVVDGKPNLGASIQAALVKQSGRYDYRVLELGNESCRIAFLERASGEVIGESTFTIEDAKNAGLLAKKGDNWKRYPRNMLFSRAMTNGVGWFCPDVLGGKFYTAEELERE